MRSAKSPVVNNPLKVLLVGQHMKSVLDIPEAMESSLEHDLQQEVLIEEDITLPIQKSSSKEPLMLQLLPFYVQEDTTIQQQDVEEELPFKRIDDIDELLTKYSFLLKEKSRELLRSRGENRQNEDEFLSGMYIEPSKSLISAEVPSQQQSSIQATKKQQQQQSKSKKVMKKKSTTKDWIKPKSPEKKITLKIASDLQKIPKPNDNDIHDLDISYTPTCEPVEDVIFSPVNEMDESPLQESKSVYKSSSKPSSGKSSGRSYTSIRTVTTSASYSYSESYSVTDSSKTDPSSRLMSSKGLSRDDLDIQTQNKPSEWGKFYTSVFM